MTRMSGSGGREAPTVELTYNWDSEDYGEARYFGHLAFEVDDIYALCDRLMKAGVTINRPPRDGMMAFVRSPDRHSIELLQKGERLPPPSPGPRCRTPGSGEPGRHAHPVGRSRWPCSAGDAFLAPPAEFLVAYPHTAVLPARGRISNAGLPLGTDRAAADQCRRGRPRLRRSAPVGGLLAARGKALYISPLIRGRFVRALRLAVQDAALSRRKHGFDSRRARQYGVIRGRRTPQLSAPPAPRTRSADNVMSSGRGGCGVGCSPHP